MVSVEGQHWWYRVLHQLVFSSIQKNFTVNKDIKIVDAGCGTGGMLEFLKQRQYHNLSGFDLSQHGVEICQERGLDVIQEKIQNIKKHYFENSLDVIISCDVLYFLSSQEIKKLISEFFDLLKENGLIIINLPALNSFSGIHDLSVGINHRFSKKEILDFVDSKQFVVNKKLYWPFLLSPVIYLARMKQRFNIRFRKNVSIQSDIDLPKKNVNTFLYKLVSLENKYIRYKPWGSSIFIEIQKTDSVYSD